MENCKPTAVPMDPGLKLESAKDDQEVVNQQAYQSSVGSLLYLSTVTRPDIAFAVGTVARFASKPTSTHWAALKRILRYLRGTSDLGILYNSETNMPLVAYSDADWAGDVNDRKSTSGYIFQLSGAAVSWRSKKQNCVALSSAEADDGTWP